MKDRQTYKKVKPNMDQRLKYQEDSEESHQNLGKLSSWGWYDWFGVFMYFTMFVAPFIILYFKELYQLGNGTEQKGVTQLHLFYKLNRQAQF